MRFAKALRVANANRATRGYPGADDERTRRNVLRPAFTPKFPLEFAGLKVFTIGSCFARNIEEELVPLGAQLPTLVFSAPKSEWPYRPNGLLNEYNPGTMRQRILYALEGRSFSEEAIVPSGSLFADLLLPGGGSDVTRERALERRQQIAQVYTQLRGSSVVVVTLGFVEGWFDEETGFYLNQVPLACGQKSPDRFRFCRLDVDDCMDLLEEPIDALIGAGVKIVLTVSPVPLQTTFSGEDCIVANEFSKSVLRVCAQRLSQRMEVDYFPAYEIVRSGGLQAFAADNVHVRTSWCARSPGIWSIRTDRLVPGSGRHLLTRTELRFRPTSRVEPLKSSREVPGHRTTRVTGTRASIRRVLRRSYAHGSVAPDSTVDVSNSC